jgi:hypothetical protein
MSDIRLELTLGDLETILTSLEYSKMHVRDAQGTPYEVRQENLARLDTVAAKIRAARNRKGE